MTRAQAIGADVTGLGVAPLGFYRGLQTLSQRLVGSL
jgi:hypothetical protein